ncbi:chemotaxis protein CheD [Paracoccus zhouxuedongae]|uniref:chemotaxis protein CheD n=1 Tax=Paracoccus sp. p4-l81 TaxID=3342806 RepID=UPI0035BC5DBD
MSENRMQGHQSATRSSAYSRAGMRSNSSDQSTPAGGQRQPMTQRATTTAPIGAGQGPASTSRSITQGEYASGGAGFGLISTVLGSCVAACLHDPVAQVGGMNHFLLPDGTNRGGAAASYGVNAMELLINDLIKHGASKSRLTAKMFGGARMVQGLSDVGAKNAEFILRFLTAEGISCLSQSLGGTHARRVEFWPDTGRARQKLLRETAATVDLPLPVARDDADSGLELF